MIYLNNNTDTQVIYIPRKAQEPEYAPFKSKPLEINIDTVKVQDNLMTYSRSIRPEKDTDSYGVVTVSMEIPMSEEKLTDNGVFSFNMPVGTVQVEVDDEAAYNQGYEEGYDAGVTTGRDEGYESGKADGYASGVEDGYATGKNDGYASGVEDTKNNAEDIYITENGVYEGELYKKIEVVVPKLINVKDFEVSFGSSAFKKIPEWFDFTGRVYLTQLFTNCINLTDLEQSTFTNLSPIKTDYMFRSCGKLKNLDPIAGWDTSKLKDMSYMFEYCSNLEDLTPIASWDTSKVDNMRDIFANCTNLHTVPALSGESLRNNAITFGYFNELTKLVNYGGLTNLKSSQNDDYYLKLLPNLSYESCINVLNGLYDFTGNGETPSSTQGKLKVHQNFINLVGSQVSIATDKGWTITT